jgi:hypothetical protein
LKRYKRLFEKVFGIAGMAEDYLGKGHLDLLRRSSSGDMGLGGKGHANRQRDALQKAEKVFRHIIKKNF